MYSFLLGDSMNELLQELFPYLRDAAYSRARYSAEYTAQCRRAERAHQALWETFTAQQRKLYLQYEAERNAQYTVEEEQLMDQVFSLAKELYR